jgi:hypothetical protein
LVPVRHAMTSRGGCRPRRIAEGTERVCAFVVVDGEAGQGCCRRADVKRKKGYLADAPR